MDSWFLVLLGLAVWRVTRMLYEERGPLDSFTRFRALLAKRQKRMGGLYDLISCFFCISVWVGALFALFISRDPLQFLAHTFILSAVASIIFEILTLIKKNKKESNERK